MPERQHLSYSPRIAGSTEPFRFWAILLVTLWAVIADSWARALISNLPIRSELGLKIVDIGYIFLAQNLALAIGSVAMAVLIALAGVRWAYGAAILGDALAILLLGGVHGLRWLVIASACRGFFDGAILAGGIQVVAERIPARFRGVAVGLFLGAVQVTTVTGPLLTYQLYEHLSRYLFFLLAAVGFLAFSFWIRLCEPGHPKDSDSQSISRDLNGVFRAPQTLALILGAALTSPVAAHFVGPEFMRSWYNRDPDSLGWLLIVPMGLSASGAPLGGLCSDLLVWRGWPRWKSHRLVAQMSALSVFLLAVVLISNPALAAIVTGVSLLGYQALIAVLYTAAADSLPKRGLPFAVLLANLLSGYSVSFVGLISRNVAPQWGFWPLLVGLTVMGTAAAMIAVRHLLGPAKKTADRYFSPRLASPPGGLWRRLIAFALDLVVCGVAVYFADIILKPLAGGTESIPLVVALAFIFLWLYFACFESSTIQATLGKRALGVFVTDEEGQRVSFGRASARHFGKILSSPFALGFLMAAFTEDHQTVHDLISQCVVVKK